MATPTVFDGLQQAVKALVEAERRAFAAGRARAALPPGSSRARVTTANARWTIAAEARDRALEKAREVAAEVLSTIGK